MKRKKGFTLIEILIVIGIIAILASITISAINPGKQFKQARDTQRMAHMAAILDGLNQNMVDNGGVIMCSGTKISLPATSTIMQSSGSANIADCLVPEYLSSLPVDPYIEQAHFVSITDYFTGYTLYIDPSGRITVSATPEARQQPISVSR